MKIDSENFTNTVHIKNETVNPKIKLLLKMYLCNIMTEVRNHSIRKYSNSPVTDIHIRIQ